MPCQSKEQGAKPFWLVPTWAPGKASLAEQKRAFGMEGLKDGLCWGS